MTALLWVLAAAGAWLLSALGIAVVFCKGAQRRDCCPHVDLDDEPSLDVWA